MEQPFPDMMKLQTRPYRRLRVVGKLWSGEIRDEYLLKILASHLYELYLDSELKLDEDYWKMLIFESTPQLKKLSIGGNYNQWLGNDFDLRALLHQQQNLKWLEVPNNIHHDFPFSWPAFLSTFTKLEVLVQPGESSDWNAYKEDCTFAEFIQAAKEIKSRNPENLPIHHLDVISRNLEDKEILEWVVTLLHDVKFPLKTLKIDIQNGTNETVIQQLLSLYADTLEALVIMRKEENYSQYADSLEAVIPFTELMKSLKCLEIYGPFLKNMSTLQYTPNLEKLSICEVAFSEYSLLEVKQKDWNEFPSTTQMVDEVVDEITLCKLSEFNAYFTLENAETVKILGRWMPNLQKLRVRVTSGTAFGEICHQWGNTLRKLVLGSRSYLVDEDIMGLGRSEGNLVPNVTMLKHLHVFLMEDYICDCWETGTPQDSLRKCIKVFSKIANHSVRHGFLELPMLHTLELNSTENISSKCRYLLKTKGINAIFRVMTDCTCTWRPIEYFYSRRGHPRNHFR